MKITTAFAAILPAFALAACGSEQPEPDTSYEEQLPAPVPEGGEGLASVPDNDSIEGGPDEQVDEQYAGDAQLPESMDDTAGDAGQ